MLKNKGSFYVDNVNRLHLKVIMQIIMQMLIIEDAKKKILQWI